MLKKFALLFFCGFLSLNSKAQNFGGGFKIGLSTSQVGGDNLAGFNKAGLLIGVFANKNISNLLSFQMEMAYINKGSNNANMNNYSHSNYLKEDISLSYIEIPLLLKYKQSDELKIETGTLMGYLIDGYYNDMSGKMYSEINPFANYDIGLLLGIEYNYSKNISLNTRLSNSILPIGTEDYENQSSYNSKIKGKYNSVLSFSLNYNFL
tara:strand:- start:108 stop:731 length:624 start_codon:yes stop_codon:yes gene_type:complete